MTISNPKYWFYIQSVIPGQMISRKGCQIKGCGQIRWPILVFSLFGIYKKIGLSKEPLLTKLRILEFPCPGMTHNTILAIMPQEGGWTFS